MRRLLLVFLIIIFSIVIMNNTTQPVVASAHTVQTGDAWAQKIRLTASESGPHSIWGAFGFYVALSADGKIALVNTLSGSSQNGVYIYLWRNGRWSEHQRIDCNVCGSYYGKLAALSADGNYVLVGTNGAIFVRNGDIWEFQQRLVQPGQATTGYALAISADGSTALLGDPYAANHTGITYVYVRTASTWTLQKQIDSYPNRIPNDTFGFAVALSADGSTALINAQGWGRTSYKQGWSYFFTRTGTTWSEGQEVTGHDSIAQDTFGWSMALSSDGNTAIIGAPYTCSSLCSNFSTRGSAYIFKRNGNNWLEQQKLIGNVNSSSKSFFGGSVSISGNGDAIAISDVTEMSNAGDQAGYKSYVFARNGTNWLQEQELDSPLPGVEQFGICISISEDGNTVLVGANRFPVDGRDIGAAYIFSRQPSTPPTPYPDHPGVYYNGAFYLRESNTNGNADVVSYFGGDPSDLPIAGDWNGDGISTIGVYRGSSGQFFLSDSNPAPNLHYMFTFGNPGDAPLAGRWDAEITRDGVGVYRNSNGILYLKDYLSTGFSDYFAVFGNPGDQGVAGDWDGDGFDSVGIYRPANQTWYLTNNHTPSGITFSDLAFYNAIVGPGQPITGDWNADGISTTGSYFATVSGVFTECVTNANPAGCSAIGFGPNGGRGITGYWGLTPSKPSPVYGVLQPAAPPIDQNNNIDGDTD